MGSPDAIGPNQEAESSQRGPAEHITQLARRSKEAEGGGGQEGVGRFSLCSCPGVFWFVGPCLDRAGDKASAAIAHWVPLTGLSRALFSARRLAGEVREPSCMQSQKQIMAP
jgi:hypothetical protein